MIVCTAVYTSGRQFSKLSLNCGRQHEADITISLISLSCTGFSATIRPKVKLCDFFCVEIQFLNGFCVQPKLDLEILQDKQWLIKLYIFGKKLGTY